MRPRLFVATATLAVTTLLAPTAAFADDHLFTAAGAEGSDERGFANPVASNPSGTSGPAAQPATVPGLGDPKVGEDTGTPAVSLEVLLERLEARSNGQGPSME